MHLEAIAYSATAPGAGAPAAAVTGDSLVIKNSKGPAKILAAWGRQQVEGFQQFSFPSGHDTTRGYRVNVEAGLPQQLLCTGIGMEVQPQELVSITIAGSAVAGDVEQGLLMMHYDDLPGVDGRFITWEQVKSRAQLHTTVSATLTGTAAGWTGSELITAESDLLRANRDYAVLGATTNTLCAAVAISGPDTAYQRCPVPGNPDTSQELQDWFSYIARAYGRPMIPVINSGNKASTFISFLQNEDNITPLVTLYLALLK